VSAPKRVRTAPTESWDRVQLRLIWPDQRQYELIRPVVLFGLTPAERAAETGISPRTIARQADSFEAEGLAALRDTVLPKRLSADLRQALRALKAEYPAFTPSELVTIAAVRFGRRLSYHTVTRVLAEEPLAPPHTRRFASYHQLATGTERRLVVIRLHVEGWSVRSIAGYLETSRPTVYTVLQRWVAEDFAGLPDKPRTRKRRALKTELRAVEAVRTLQQNPELGAFRMRAALQQLGIELSERTCGRILQTNRALYGLPGPEKKPRTPKPMPYAAKHRHQYWSVDLRYIDVHRIDGEPVYCIAILENYSRAILASALCRRQDLSAYLVVLYAALREYGSPAALVSDNGSVFKAARAKTIYAALGLTHERIEHHQPWQDYIETAFNIQRRMADWHFAKATTWAELQQVHDRWVEDYNAQAHWAHRTRRDGRRSPTAVLDWVIGTPHDPLTLARLFRPLCATRRLDRVGYVRFRHWRVYGERGLPQQSALVWLSEEILTVGYGEEPLAYYTVAVDRTGQLTTVTAPRLVPTQHQSQQPWLWPLSPEEWLLALQRPAVPRRRRPRPVTPAVQTPFLFAEAAFSPAAEAVTDA
jgi:putative transposase